MYWVVFYPTDVIKSAMMTDSLDPSKRTHTSIGQTVRTLYDQGGVRRFYTGLAPCLLRSVPANAIMLTVVDTVGRKISPLLGVV